MPLSKKKNRDRMRAIRATQVQPNPVQPSNRSVQPVSVAQGSTTKLQAVMPKLQEVGLKMDGNRIQGALQSTTSPVETQINTIVPRYDKRVHKEGDTVLMRTSAGWTETVVPELDGEGNPVPGM